jgi:hypothetical protein
MPPHWGDNRISPCEGGGDGGAEVMSRGGAETVALDGEEVRVDDVRHPDGREEVDLLLGGPVTLSLQQQRHRICPVALSFQKQRHRIC